MRKRVRLLAALVAAVAFAGLAAAAASGSRGAEPGLTSKSILFGGVFPFTGPAAAYGTIARAEQAYFNWVNDTKGGVNGRKINFKVVDDAYVPAQAAQLMLGLIEQDHIFAGFSDLGTEVNIAIQDEMKANKVPNLFVATGASQFGLQHKQYPWQIGYQPDYVSENLAYGKFIRTKMPQAKIGVLAQNDAYGDDSLKGLRKGLGKAVNRIVSVQKYNITDTGNDMGGYVSKLKSSGANVFVDIATPGYSIPALVAAGKLGWNPIATFVNAVSAPDRYMKLASSLGARPLMDSAYSILYAKDPGDSRLQKDPAIVQYKSILGKYCSTCNAGDAFNTFGFSTAYTLVTALKQAGKNVTRAKLVKAVDNLNIKNNPYLLPGIHVTTSDKCKDYFPVSQLRLAKYNLDGGFYNGLGSIVNGRPTPKGVKC